MKPRRAELYCLPTSQGQPEESTETFLPAHAPDEPKQAVQELPRLHKTTDGVVEHARDARLHDAWPGVDNDRL